MTAPSLAARRGLLIAILLVAVALRLYRLDALPPGLLYDEGAYGLDAGRVLAAGDVRPFYAENNGREPLFIWLEALALGVLGHTPLALRLTAALVGLLMLPVHYRVARGLLAAERHGQAAALLSLAALAVLYWHVHFSRLGLRAILLPLAALLVVGTFWRAWRGGGARAWLLAGVCLGASQYTYLAARLLPGVLAAFVAWEAAAALRWRRAGAARQVRQRAGGLALMAAAALAVVAPLLVYLLQHPAHLAARTGDVSLFSAPTATWPGTPPQRLVDNTGRVLRLFLDRGDLNANHNLPGRPALDPLLWLLFAVGLAVALARLRRPLYRLLLLWLGGLLLPTWLSAEAPHMLRALGVVPVVCLLAGLGGAEAAAWLAARVHRPATFRQTAALALLVLAVGGSLTARDYFTRWPQHPTTGVNFDQRRTQVSRAALAWTETGDVLLPLSLFAYPNSRFLLYPRYPRLAVAPPEADTTRLAAARWLVISPDAPAEPLVWLQGGAAPAAYLLHAPDGTQRAALSARLAAAWADAQPLHDHNGAPVAFAVTLTPDMAAWLPPPVQPRVPLALHAADGLALVAYDIGPPQPAPGEAFYLTLFWQAAVPRAEPPRPFVHLLDAQEGVWANGTPPPVGATYPVVPWPVQEIIPDVYTLPLPDGMPPVKLRPEIGLLDGGARQTLYDAAGQPLGQRALLGAVAVAGADVGAGRTAAQVTDLTFGAAIVLRGYTVQGHAAPGQTLTVELLWEARAQPAGDVQTFVHLVDGQGQMVAQHDQTTGGAANPSGWWLVGERVADTYTLAIPAGAPSGPYTLRVGLYRLPDAVRLPVTGAQAHADGYAALPVAPP